MKVIALFIIYCLFRTQPSHAQFGNWSMPVNELPVYNYTGAIPVTAFDKDGKDADLPEDAYFLLGNYRMTLITHVSGIYQFLTAERAWARINASEQTNYGWNDATLVFKNERVAKKITLTGMESIAADTTLVNKSFGVGFARYTYRLNNGIRCSRIISIKPSQKINTGNPAFVVTVILTNNGAKTQKLSYRERILVNYVLNGTQYTDAGKRPLAYGSQVTIHNNRQVAIADLSCKTNGFLVLPQKTERFIYDVNPPSVFMHSNATGTNYKSIVTTNGDTLSTEVG